MLAARLTGQDPHPEKAAMAESAELDEPSDDRRPSRPGRAVKKGVPDLCGVPPLAKGHHRREAVENELTNWYRLTSEERSVVLRAAADGSREWSPEALLHASRQAYAAGDRRGFNLAFEAFATRATPLLLEQAWGTAANERRDQVQEILVHTFKAIRDDAAADYAEVNFADFAEKKSISLHRARKSRFEGSFDRIEPTDVDDPIDELPDRMPGAEARALLKHSVGKLEGKFREVFIQRHVLGLTLQEIGEQHGVDESTVRLWLKRANAIVGVSGGKDDRED